jgi:hypothetical protein
MNAQELKEKSFLDNMGKLLGGAMYSILMNRFGKEKAEEILNQVIFVIADADATNPLAKPDEVIN